MLYGSSLLHRQRFFVFFFCFFLVTGLPGCLNKKTTKISGGNRHVHYKPISGGKALSSTELQAFNSTGDLDKNLSQEEKQIVEYHFKQFVHERRTMVNRFITRSARYLPYAKKVFKERGLPEELAYLFMIESGGNPKAHSSAGAAGLWQFMPFTGKKYGLVQNKWIDERHDPFKATFAASDYLLKLYGDFKDWHLATAAYNAGEGKIGRALDGTKATDFFTLCRTDQVLDEKARLREETRQYVPKLLAMAKVMRNLQALGFTPPHENDAYTVAKVQLPAGANLKQFSHAMGMSWDEFKALNPAFKRTVSPPSGAVAYVPPMHVAMAENWVQGNRHTTFASWQEHKVRRGDTLAGISRKYKVSLAELKDVNNIKSLPKVGSSLVIPRGQARSLQATAPSKASLVTAAGGKAVAGQQASSGASGMYTVQAGDSLLGLSRKWGVSASQIQKANSMKSVALKQGQRLVIPQTAVLAQGNKKSVLPSSSGVPAAAGASQSARPVSHTVVAGDTLYNIAQRYGVSVADLTQMNNMTATQPVRLGQKLRVISSQAGSDVPKKLVASANQQKLSAGKKKLQSSPAKGKKIPRSVTVRSGDTLFSLARKHNTSVLALRKANKLSAANHLRQGQRLIIPQ